MGTALVNQKVTTDQSMTLDLLVNQLYYFNARGRAETIRLTFVMSGIQFEDCRIEGRDWAALKPKTPTGRLPYLEVTAADGTIRSYDESGAIVRWLAKSHDLMGNSNEQYYRIERVIGQCTDIDNEMVGIFHAKTDEDKVSRSRKFQKESGVKLLKLLKESLLESTDKFVAGSNVTLGNLTLMTTVDLVDAHFAELMKNQFPELLKHRQDVLSCHPKLAEYVKSRPVSQW
ncbi:unnamed protein product [Calicophoron daubneyi]|uniref:Uncharacterized protein n=1 Tax=Calicophoron daubneyi TaxID=300641 RepID=A0AAV2TK54_CALDB